MVKVVRILKENNIPLKVNYKEYEKLKKNHLSDTRVIAAKIYSALPAELKSQVNLQDLQQAAMLHDFGKILIPDNILNKHRPLTDKEKEIVALHSELGYEMLKNQNLNKNVLNLIKYHHQLPNGSGYPKIKEDYLPDKASEILMAADKYSALREQRSYKDAMSRQEALDTIKEDVNTGLISPEIYQALVKVS